MPTATPVADDHDRRKDLGLLVRLIEVSLAYLRWFILESDGVPRHLRRLFAGPVLDDVERRLQEAIDVIRRVESSDDPTWRALELAGLTGAQLEVKAAVLETIQRRRRRSFGEWIANAVTGVSLSRAETILEWLNSFFGSLKSAIPGVEAVKECKDQVKLAINHQLRKEPPMIGLGLGDRAQ